MDHAAANLIAVRGARLISRFDLFLRVASHGINRRALAQRIVISASDRPTSKVDVIFVIHVAIG